MIVAVAATWVATTVAAGPTELAGVVYVAGSWLLGHYVHTRRLLVAELEQRAADLERQREEQAARAVAEERLRIARELHDILAHTMSVVAVQAGTGRLVGPDHPDAAIDALGRRGDDGPIGDAGAASDPHRAPRRRQRRRRRSHPPPGLDDLPALIAQVTEAGIDVDMRVEGEPRPFPPASVSPPTASPKKH